MCAAQVTRRLMRPRGVVLRRRRYRWRAARATRVMICLLPARRDRVVGCGGPRALAAVRGGAVSQIASESVAQSSRTAKRHERTAEFEKGATEYRTTPRRWMDAPKTTNA